MQDIKTKNRFFKKFNKIGKKKKKKKINSIRQKVFILCTLKGS